MRKILEDPVGHLEELTQVLALVSEIYSAHEAGQSYDALLKGLSKRTGRIISEGEIHGAFGSVRSDTFARRLLLKPELIPSDLSRDEMLELFQRVLMPGQNEFQLGYWVACLEKNTRNRRVSDLIYWPGEYFGDGDNSREMEAEELLQVALADGGVANGT